VVDGFLSKKRAHKRLF